jgi:phage shock protein C
MERRLMKDNDNRLISGVCSGIANYLNTDPSIVRLITVVLFFITGGGILLAYIIMAVILPSNDSIDRNTKESMQDINAKLRKKPVDEFALNPDDYTFDEADYQTEDPK